MTRLVGTPTHPTRLASVLVLGFWVGLIVGPPLVMAAWLALGARVTAP